MKRWTLLIIIFFSSSAFAQSACYKNEENPFTGTAFASEADYLNEISAWQNKNPGAPNPYYLYKAYRVYETEKITAGRLKSDKQAHCYMGCRISQATSYATADYVGWLKEDRDLKDCSKHSHYDDADYVATLRGAQFGTSLRDAKECLDSCVQTY